MATVAWQTTNSLLLHAGLISGVKRDLERTQAFSQMPSTFCRRQGWLKEPPVDEEVESAFALEERWRRWRDREEIKRLGFAAIVSFIRCRSVGLSHSHACFDRCSEEWAASCGTSMRRSSTSMRRGQASHVTMRSGCAHSSFRLI